MSEEYLEAAEASPTESLKAWAETLSEAEIQEIDSIISVYQYNGKAAPELLLLNQKGVEALKGLTQINKEPEQIIDGYYELSPVERSQTLSEKKLEFKQQLESSLALAKDKLYDYSDAEIAQFEKEAETLFTSPAGFKQAA